MFHLLHLLYFPPACYGHFGCARQFLHNHGKDQVETTFNGYRKNSSDTNKQTSKKDRLRNITFSGDWIKWTFSIKNDSVMYLKCLIAKTSLSVSNGAGHNIRHPFSWKLVLVFTVIPIPTAPVWRAPVREPWRTNRKPWRYLEDPANSPGCFKMCNTTEIHWEEYMYPRPS